MRDLLFSYPRKISWFLLVVVLILLAAAALYFHGIVQILPYHLDADEPNIWLFANYLMNHGHLLNNYPPARIITLSIWFRILDWITPGAPTQTAQYMFARVATVWYTLLLLALTYQVGRLLLNRAAGAAASLFLMAQPDLVYFSKMVRVDGIGWVAAMLSILLTIIAVRSRRHWLILPAILTVGVATAGKYTLLPVIIFPGLALILTVPRRWEVRAALLVLAVLTVTGGMLMLRYPPPIVIGLLSFHRRPLYQPEELFKFVSLRRAWPDLLKQIGNINFLLVVLGIPAAILIWPRIHLNTKQWVFLGVTVATAAMTYLMLGFFITNRAQDRFLIILLFALLWGTTVAILSSKSGYGRLALASVILIAPWIAAGWQYGSSITVPDTRVMTVNWFLTHTPDGTKIALEKDFSEFSAYGGYQGNKIFFPQEIRSVYEHSLEEFARIGIDYLVADYRNINSNGFFSRKIDRQPFLSQAQVMLKLTNPYNRGWQGPDRYIFRVPPIEQHPMHVFIGDGIIFKGFDLGSDKVKPGSSIDLVLYWEGLRKTDHSYTVFVHVYDGAGKLVAQHDDLPGDPLHRTYDWEPGYFDWDEWPVVIPAEISPGAYTVKLGMYDADTLQRLPAADSDHKPLGDEIKLTVVTIGK